MSFYASYPPISSGGGGGSGTVTSVGLLDGSTSPIYTISGSPVTTSGTLTFTLGTKSANLIFAGPTTGAAAQPSFRSIVAGDLPTGNLTDAGTDGITITSGTGAVIGSGTSIAQHVADASHNGYLSSADWTTFNNKGSGSVTSVAMTVPAFLSVAGSPITSSGTLAVSYSGTALPIANGGTNSTTTLNSNRFMVSSAGAIVEASAVTASKVVVSDANGLPSAATTTTTQVQYLSSATGTTGTTSTNLVFSTSPTLVTPTLGVATATSINKVTITAPATGSTLTIADGKTLTINNSLAFSGTDSTVMTFPSSTDTVMGLGAAQTVTGNKTFAQTTLKLQDNSTNAVTLSTTNSTTSYTIKLPAAQGGASTTFQNDGSGNLTWVSAGGGSGTVTSVAMTVPAFLSVSGSPVTTSGTLAVSYSGTALPIANGGTAVTSVTTAPTATAFAGWDARSNLSANNFLAGYVNEQGPATITLTNASAYGQNFYTQADGASTIKMPAVGTLTVGQAFLVSNTFNSVQTSTSAAVLTVQTSGATAINTLQAGGWGIYQYAVNNGTAANSWNYVAGLVPGQIPANQNNTAAGQGIVGELITATGTSVSVSTSGFTTITSLTVYGGDWEVSGMVYEPGTAAVTSISGGIATATNSNTGWTFGTTAGSNPVTATFGTTVTIMPVQKLISSTGGTTYYLTAAATGATASISGTIRARRAR